NGGRREARLGPPAVCLGSALKKPAPAFLSAYTGTTASERPCALTNRCSALRQNRRSALSVRATRQERVPAVRGLPCAHGQRRLTPHAPPRGPTPRGAAPGSADGGAGLVPLQARSAAGVSPPVLQLARQCRVPDPA